MKKRILKLRSSIGVFGAEVMLLELAEAMASSTYTPVVGVIENSHENWGELAVKAREKGLETIVFNCNGPFDLRTVFCIRKYVKNHAISIIQAHGYKANFYAVASAAFLSVRCIATCHPWTERSYNMKARIYTALDKFILRKMDQLVAVSKEVQEELCQTISKKNVPVIANGVNIQRFSSSRKKDERSPRLPGVNDSDIVLGAVGRLVPEKGFDLLLRAFSKVIPENPNVKLLIIGDGELRGELEVLSDDLRINGSVIFAGIQKDMPMMLAGLDIFILSSISEGLPMVILEAMAAQKPIISSKVGELEEVLEHEVSAILVPPGDVNALRSAIINLLSDSGKQVKLALAARKRVEARFSSHRMSEQYCVLFDQLININ